VTTMSGGLTVVMVVTSSEWQCGEACQARVGGMGRREAVTMVRSARLGRAGGTGCVRRPCRAGGREERVCAVRWGDSDLCRRAVAGVHSVKLVTQRRKNFWSLNIFSFFLCRDFPYNFWSFDV
jgi:hypothetical protein